MKNLLLLKITLLAFVALTSCKKGDEDPAISLKSRDGRLKNEWKLTKIEGTTTSVSTSTLFGTTVTTTATTSYSNGNKSVTTSTTTVNSGNSINNTSTKTTVYSLIFNFEDDGVFTKTETKDNQTTTYTTAWAWIDTDKNKSMIMAQGDYYEVVGLHNNELILRTAYKLNEPNSQETSTTTWTFEPK